MAKSTPCRVNKRYAGFVIKWMSRPTTFLYRRGSDGLGGIPLVVCEA
jgi:hypothetical protein